MAESSSRRSTRQAHLRSQEASPWSALASYSSSSSSLYGQVLSSTASRDSSISSIQSTSAVKMKNSTVLFNHHHQKMRCMCSPTTHPGSFRCSLHKSLGPGQQQRFAVRQDSSNYLNPWRSAMRNSLVRIVGVVQGDFVKRALAIRPSSHQQRRRADFQKKPSRLSNKVCVSRDK